MAEAYVALARTGRLPDFHDALFQRACLDAASELIPEEVSPLSTQDFLDIVATLIEAKDPYTAGHSRTLARALSAILLLPSARSGKAHRLRRRTLTQHPEHGCWTLCRNSGSCRGEAARPNDAAQIKRARLC